MDEADDQSGVRLDVLVHRTTAGPREGTVPFPSVRVHDDLVVHMHNGSLETSGRSLGGTSAINFMLWHLPKREQIEGT